MSLGDNTTKVALVTGALGGIGKALTKALNEANWTVAVSDMVGTGADFEFDLRVRGACDELVKGVVDEYGRLDLLVNNAATISFGPLAIGDLTSWWDTIAVNLTAPFRLSRAALAPLRETQGQIINVASIWGFTGEPNFSAYSASKAGILGLTKALALELAPQVRVNAIAPGHTDTPQLWADAESAGMTLDELRSTYAASIPLRRLMQPEEVGDLVVFLANAKGFTGSCIHLNGGLLMV